MRRHRQSLTSVLAVALFLVVSEGASAQTLAPATAPAPAKPVKALKVLTLDQVDPARILPLPAADGSDAQLADLAEVQRLYRTRTPERLAQAQWDDTHENSLIFQSTLGPRFDLAKLPKTAELLALVENEQSVSANIAKRHFLRNRPWAIDPSLKACDYKPNANPRTSYPSGHATLGYSVGYVLADLIPARSEAILARAHEYAYSRVICAAHYASDIEASHVLGTVVAMKLMANPRVAAMVEAARSELSAAGVGSDLVVATH
jgi:acid phosphatase (class A)